MNDFTGETRRKLLILKLKREKKRSIFRLGDGDTRRFNEFHRDSDRYRSTTGRYIQLFSFYFFIQRKSVS